MNEKSEGKENIFLKPKNNWKIVNFDKSVKMSTYLVAYVVGELEFIGTLTERQNIPIRVYTPIGFAQQGQFALDVGKRSLDFFADYFDVPYTLPKMDMVAIPDFLMGAMENWGLVTCRMTSILFDSKKSTLRIKQNVAYTVGHELAHQWFGNLVTMSWWSDLWLNEGFATWAGWLVSDYLFPEWDIWTCFIINDFQSGLFSDSLRSSHPIEVPIKDPSDISQIFDSISYSKGASVIRMLETYLGSEVFKNGLREYIKKYSFSNACTNQLWDVLEKVSKKEVSKFMSVWIRNVGVCFII